MKGTVCMIKMIVTDVDGTIVGKDEVLHEEMVDFVKSLRLYGLYYTIATGRADGLVREYVKRLSLTVPYITCNGGAIVKPDGETVRKTIPLLALRAIFETADEMGMSLMYSIAGQEEAYRKTPYVQEQQEKYHRYRAPHGFSGTEWNELQVDKVIVMAKIRDGSLQVIEDLCRTLPPVIGYKRYANKAIDILNAGATKENGIRDVAAMMEIGMDEILFAGDDLNDIGMIRDAGIGVAVGNALDCVKEAADYVAEAPCYLGVMEAVQKLVLDLKGDREEIT